jgi:PKD repeat protein
MDSLLAMRYKMMAEENNALLAPAAQVWRFLRVNHPEIELYQGDGSHPSATGTYAAACAFYSTIFRKPANLISNNAGINANHAAIVRLASDSIVFQNMSAWFIGEYDPKAIFETIINEREVSFVNNSLFASNYFWDFGDGQTSEDELPIHTYSDDGIFTIKLQVSQCGKTSIDSMQIEILSLSNKHLEKETLITVFPNPAKSHLNIRTEGKSLGNFYLIDNLGRKVYEGFNNESSVIITFSYPLSGVHYLHSDNYPPIKVLFKH